MALAKGGARRVGATAASHKVKKEEIFLLITNFRNSDFVSNCTSNHSQESKYVLEGGACPQDPLEGSCPLAPQLCPQVLKGLLCPSALLLSLISSYIIVV